MPNGHSAAESAVPEEGFVPLLTVPHIFALDLIGKNLQLNGITIRSTATDASDETTEPPHIFVPRAQEEQARRLLSTLDLMDFTNGHGI